MNMLLPLNAPPAQSIAMDLPRVSRAAAQLTRLLYDPAFAAALTSIGAGLRLVRSDRSSGGPGETVLRLKLRYADAPFDAVVVWDDTACAQVAGLGARRLPDGLRQLALHAVFGAALDVLHAAGWAGLQLIDVEPADLPSDAGEAGRGQPPTWHQLLDGMAPIGRFSLGGLGIDTMRQARRALATGGARAEGWRGRLTLAGAVCLSESAFPLDLLSSLQPGDVLLLGARPEGTETRVRWGQGSGPRWSAPARIDETTLTLLGEPLMQAMDDDTSNTDEAMPERLDDLEMAVRFEIETQPMRLADLERIAAGQVLELKMPLESARVRLVACGRTIGHAELVAVGDRLGARVLRMAGSA